MMDRIGVFGLQCSSLATKINDILNQETLEDIELSNILKRDRKEQESIRDLLMEYSEIILLKIS